MVILIGGSSHVGKTLIAQKFLEKYKYPYLSLDHLKMGMIRAGITDLTVNDDYEMRYYLWPIVAGIIKTVVENEQNLIIEGCYIPAEWKDSFTQDYLDQIRCVFVVMSEEYIRNNADSIAQKANVIEKRVEDNVDIDRLVMCSKHFKADCIERGICCLEIRDKFDIEQIVKQAAAMLGL